MPTTNTSEDGLETLILDSLTGEASALAMTDGIRETHSDYCIKHYVQGDPADYHRSYAVDLTKLTEFLRATQPAVIDALGLETDGESVCSQDAQSLWQSPAFIGPGNSSFRL